MTTRNFIIHQRARTYQWTGDCFLSVKSFYHGSATYQVKHREYIVNDRNYLILNDCTRYRIIIDNPSVVESFCVFFSPDFVCQKVSALNATDEQQLNFSYKLTDGIKLLEKNYLHGGKVSDLLFNGRQFLKYHIPEIQKEEYYHNLLNAILAQNNESLKIADKLALKKKSTREEIYRRLLYARNFMDCHYVENLTLKEISSVAMLSENHFLRNFKRVYNSSPFQYITRLKIADAKRQISETDKSITDIALNLGYSSLSNFSYYFKSMVGLSPAEFRKKVIYSK